MPTQLNERRHGRRVSLHPTQERPIFTKEWSIPAVLTVFLLGVCGLIAYFTWSLMPPATASQRTIGAPFNLVDDRDQVFAHAHLKSSAPAADSAVKLAPSELDLTFSEDLNLKFSGVTVTGPDKKVVKTGAGTLMDGDKTLMVPVSDKLAPGKYTVQWHALSTDGDKTDGSYSFTVAP